MTGRGISQYVSGNNNVVIGGSADGILPSPVDGMHPDERGVLKLAKAMLDKLEKKRNEGRDGWHDPDVCDVEELAHLLLEHLRKGDLVDVANFVMMLFNRDGGAEALQDVLDELDQYGG